jgi:hypothetical protein
LPVGQTERRLYGSMEESTIGIDLIGSNLLLFERI